MKQTHLRWLVGTAILLVVLFRPGETLYAQEGEGERGRIEIGIRQIFGDHSSSKFNEYRHIPQGFFIQQFELNLPNLLNDKFFFNFQSRETLERDQSYLLDLGAYRKYRLELAWDQTPHVFTNTAKSFFVESSPGVFTAPAPLRSRLQSQPADLSALLEGARPLNLSLRRNAGRGTLTYTPASDWTLQFQYSREKQTGVRPFGTTTNSFTNTIELPEPIDYRTHQVKAGAEYANQRAGVQASYSGSIFHNEISTLVWDNPFRLTDAVGGGSRGRLDLYPDNAAHNLSFAGALNISPSTRLIVSVVPGWMRQNDTFLPFTVNTAIPDVPSLPATSLNGKKQTLSMNYTLMSRAVPALPLTLRYRSYDYNNDTPSLIFSRYVGTDGSLSAAGIARRNLPYAYDRKNLGFDASWEFLKKSSLKFLYEWERFDREHRDVERSNEHTVGASLDLNPRQWVLFRTSYKRSERDPEHYEANEESFPLGEGPTALGQLHGLQKLDEASRGRDRAEALIQIYPADTVTFAASYGTTQDDYNESTHGLLKDINHNYTFELTYTPRPEISFFSEYTREKFKYRQRSRQRVPPTATAPANDSPNNDWETHRRDLVDTWAAGVNGSIIDKLTFDAFYSLSAAKNSIFTRALGSARIPGFLVTTAQDYPDTSNRLHQVVASIKVRLGALYPKFEYRYEKYDRIDFQLERLGQYLNIDPSTATSIFLGIGADIPGYNAHIAAVSLEYRF
ncbi:MAG: MtrB/PioB family decaheme-associated outer membrane protein [Acidobacteria bacterium]|nr:MtrB/PioB family decaheme-associated outer membrane protein [Acidobacteriota bacterium]